MKLSWFTKRPFVGAEYRRMETMQWCTEPAFEIVYYCPHREEPEVELIVTFDTFDERNYVFYHTYQKIHDKPYDKSLTQIIKDLDEEYKMRNINKLCDEIGAYANEMGMTFEECVDDLVRFALDMKKKRSIDKS